MKYPKQWPGIVEGLKWLAGYKCQLCGWRNQIEAVQIRLEGHHNEYNETVRREDILILCSACHAMISFILEHLAATTLHFKARLRKARTTRVSLEDVRVYFEQYFARWDDILDRLGDEMEQVRSMADGRRSAEEWKNNPDNP